MKRACIAFLMLALMIAMAGCSPFTAYQTFSREELGSMLGQFCDLANSLGYEVMTASNAAAAATTTASTGMGAPVSSTLSRGRWVNGGYWSGPDAEGWYQFAGQITLNYFSSGLANLQISVVRIRSTAANHFEVKAGIFGYTGLEDFFRASYVIDGSGKLSGSFVSNITMSSLQSGKAAATSRMISGSTISAMRLDFSNLTAVTIEDPEAKANIGDNIFVGGIDFHRTELIINNGAKEGPDDFPVAHLVSNVNKKEDNIQYLEFGAGSWYDNLSDSPNAGQVGIAGASSAIAM